MTEKTAKNTDKELYRRDLADPSDPDNFYAPSVHVTKDGKIGMNVGGMTYIATIEEWHSSIADRCTNGGG